MTIQPWSPELSQDCVPCAVGETSRWDFRRRAKFCQTCLPGTELSQGECKPCQAEMAAKLLDKKVQQSQLRIFFVGWKIACLFVQRSTCFILMELQAGYFSDVPGSAKCSPCLAGTFQRNVGRGWQVPGCEFWGWVEGKKLRWLQILGIRWDHFDILSEQNRVSQLAYILGAGPHVCFFPLYFSLLSW